MISVWEIPCDFTNKAITSSAYRAGEFWSLWVIINESDLFFKNLSKDKYYHLSYQDFIEDTEDSLKEIYNFLNLNTSEEFLSILSKNISRKNKTITKTDDKLILEMGGEILKQTINNNYSPF